MLNTLFIKKLGNFGFKSMPFDNFSQYLLLLFHEKLACASFQCPLVLPLCFLDDVQLLLKHLFVVMKWFIPVTFLIFLWNIFSLNGLLFRYPLDSAFLISKRQLAFSAIFAVVFSVESNFQIFDC